MKVIISDLINRIINMFGNRLDANICFIHIPKCAGTSVNHEIRAHYLTLNFRKDRCLLQLDPVATVNVVKIIEGTEYPYNTNDDYAILKLRERLLLYFMNQKNIKYVTGHFTFSDFVYQKFRDKYAFITMLRDPVKRYISSYFYNKFKNPRFTISGDIATYMESEFGQSQGYEYVKFLCGADKNGDYTSYRAIERAKENLHKFDIVGILEYMESFREQFKYRFGVRFEFEHRNKSPKSQTYQRSIINEEIEDKIKSICKPDREIYQYAIDTFIKTNQ